MAETTLASAAIRSLCTFRADKRLYGIDVAHLREISTSTDISPVPQAPPFVRGLLNLRSRIMLIVDLRPMLGLSPIDFTPEHRLLILKPQVLEDVGILIDSGGDIVKVAASQIEAWDESQANVSKTDHPVASTLVCGVCKLESELLMIVDPMRIAGLVSAAIR